ncbi:MAG: SagB/ThcOx family dehydrogenase [Bacteroidia bacterium]|nr:SagB/ThcOx family dehydrogenase [Bacteroidia bacterium]
MKTIHFISTALILIAMSLSTLAQDIKLPDPDKKGGVPLMQALNDRASTREYDSRNLTDEQLSNLLWAAWGINRPGEGKHTAPSSNNKQEMSVYIALESGLYLYVPESHLLKQIHNRDIRAVTGKQDFVGIAAVNLIFVADLAKAGIRDPEKAGPESLNTSNINTGFMAQNVYLYCASEKLACVVRGWLDIPELHKAMELTPNQRIIVAQTVGHPKN